jgi:hypothetical protein
MDAPLERVRSRRSARCTCNNNFFQHYFFSSKFSVVGGEAALPSRTDITDGHHGREEGEEGEEREEGEEGEEGEEREEG